MCVCSYQLIRKKPTFSLQKKGVELFWRNSVHRFSKEVTIKILLFLPICTFSNGFSLFAEQIIKGTVTGIDATPLPGTSILVKASNAGLMTDSASNFRILANKGNNLEFSVLKLSLILSTTNLDEKVVTEYSLQKVKEITSSATLLNASLCRIGFSKIL